MITLLTVGCLFAHPMGDGRVIIGRYINMGEIYVPPSHVFPTPHSQAIVCRTGSGWILYDPRA